MIINPANVLDDVTYQSLQLNFHIDNLPSVQGQFLSSSEKRTQHLCSQLKTQIIYYL